MALLAACSSAVKPLRPALPYRPTPYPQADDYGTLTAARATVHASLRERDWRRKSYGAFLGLSVLMTIRPLLAGPCAVLVGRTYDELLDLHDAYQGENWAPLVRTVRRDPPLSICLPPKPSITNAIT